MPSFARVGMHAVYVKRKPEARKPRFSGGSRGETALALPIPDIGGTGSGICQSVKGRKFQIDPESWNPPKKPALLLFRTLLCCFRSCLRWAGAAARLAGKAAWKL